MYNVYIYIYIYMDVKKCIYISNKYINKHVGSAKIMHSKLIHMAWKSTTLLKRQLVVST